MFIGADSVVPLSLLVCPKAALFVPMLPKQLNLSSSSAKQWPFLHPIWCQVTSKRYSNWTALCTQSLCPESHQLLGQGKPPLWGPGLQPPWGDGISGQLLHGISRKKKKKRQFSKTYWTIVLQWCWKKMSLVPLWYPFTPQQIHSFPSESGGPFDNCSLCTADTG